jgi:hypothetical protein
MCIPAPLEHALKSERVQIQAYAWREAASRENEHVQIARDYKVSRRWMAPWVQFLA